MDNKRKNFTIFEKQLLMQLVGKNKTTLDNKCTKTFYVQQKQNVWTAITEEFNCSAESGPRSVKQLKVLYENLKREVRRDVAEEHQLHYLEKITAAKVAAENAKQEILKTGAGTPPCAIKNELEKLLTEVKEESQPCDNQYDSDALYINEELVIVSPKPEPVEFLEMSERESSSSSTIRKKKKVLKKRKTTFCSAEQYRKLYFRQKYINAVNEGRRNKIIQELQIKKLRCEIKNLK